MKKFSLFSVLCALILTLPCIAMGTSYYEEYTGREFFDIYAAQERNFGFNLWVSGSVTDDSSLVLTTDAVGAYGTYSSGYIFAKFEDDDPTGPSERATIKFDIFADGASLIDLGTYTFTGSYEVTIPLSASFLNDLDNSGSGTLNLTLSAFPGTDNDFYLRAVGVGVDAVAPVPEPATMLLLGLGLMGLAGIRKKLQ